MSDYFIMAIGMGPPLAIVAFAALASLFERREH